MPDPQTTNALLNVPLTGSDVGTWGSGSLNPNFSAIDGYVAGVQTISVSNVPVTLTSPSGTPTPGGGPTQAQNAVLSFTGTLTSGVQITLPLPGVYQVENLTTGNFVLSFRAAGVGQVIALDQGMSERIYCDGTNVRFGSLGVVGRTEIWAGLSSIPAWVAACTKRPYLLCDGTIYNFSDYPYLGARLGGAFGGNGITTFAVPDLRGRMALPYDGTGTRITASVSGINGQSLGASADNQGVILSASQIPSITSNGNNSVTVAPNGNGNFYVPMYGNASWSYLQTAGTAGAAFVPYLNNVLGTQTNTFSNSSVPISVTSNNTGGLVHNNVQPSQVTGIAVIRAA